MNTSAHHLKTVLNYAKGGIGNQLFQHVFACSLAKRLGAELVTDISYFGHDPYGFKAMVWNLSPEAKSGTVAQYVGPGAYLLKEGQIQTLDQLQQLPADATTLVLDGYWQRESLLDREVGRRVYAQLGERAKDLVDADLVSRISANPQAVALHIRRRDYGHMGLCKSSYYLGALRYLRTCFSELDVFVFTDEPNYARHLLAGSDQTFTLVSSGSDLGDLFLMSLCRHFIISNSSYSWWAAWFGEHKGGLVFCPKEWVTIDSTPSPCPSRWLQIAGAVQPFSVDEAEISSVAEGVQRQRFDAAIRNWFADRGDETLRVQFGELGPDSVVLDLGGYKGDWTAEIIRRYDSVVHVFEPIGEFYKQICTRFALSSKVYPHQMGLGARDENMEMHHSADGTGLFGVGGAVEIVQLREAKKLLDEIGVDRIDLLKINIEGGEYELLEHLIDTGCIAKVRRLQVQFHDFVPDAIRLRAKIGASLAKTHRQSWCYYFVWEEWILLGA